MTGARNTQTFAEQGLTISVTRRDQLCVAMSSRLGLPTSVQWVAPGADSACSQRWLRPWGDGAGAGH